MEKFKRSYINYVLIAANIVYFLFLEMHGSTETDLDMMLRYGAMYEPAVLEGHEYYRLITSCFMHFGMSHLVNNMLVLFVLGSDLEDMMGHIKYLVFYLLCGIGANLISLYVNMSAGDYVISAGASGAIFGVVGGLFAVVIKNHGYAGGYDMRQLVIYIVLSVYMGYSSSGVDNAAHIGGLITGLLLCAIIYRTDKRRNYYA